MSFPACLSSAVSVGSTTKTDVVSSFTNAGPGLALLAPGEPIRSSVPGGGFAYKSGTSMAAPHVAGAWAVLKQRKPEAGVDEVLGVLRGHGRTLRDTRAATGGSFARLQLKASLDALVLADPLMVIDTPRGGTTAQPFKVAGWAVDRGAPDGAGVDAVHVWAYPADGRAPIFAGVAATGLARTDVGAVLGSRFTNSGYEANLSGLGPGGYRLVVFAHSTLTGTFNQARVVDVTIPASSPLMVLDVPSNPAALAGSFIVAGWAIDRAASGGTGVDAVHVWAFPLAGNPIFVGAARYGISRTDVGAVLGHQFDASGFSLGVAVLPAGTYDVVVFAHSAVAGTFNQARVARITIAP
jgi:subtilisin family serine protease